MNCVSGGRFFTVVFLTYVKGSVLLVFLQLLLKRIAFKNELNRTQSLWSSWKVSIGSDRYNDNEKMSFCNSPIVKTFSIWAAVAIIVFDHYYNCLSIQVFILLITCIVIRCDCF